MINNRCQKCHLHPKAPLSFSFSLFPTVLLLPHDTFPLVVPFLGAMASIWVCVYVCLSLCVNNARFTTEIDDPLFEASWHLIPTLTVPIGLSLSLSLSLPLPLSFSLFLFFLNLSRSLIPSLILEGHLNVLKVWKLGYTGRGLFF